MPNEVVGGEELKVGSGRADGLCQASADIAGKLKSQSDKFSRSQ